MLRGYVRPTLRKVTVIALVVVLVGLVVSRTTNGLSALLCLPLLLFGWALYRGRTWGAFSLLGHATGLMTATGLGALSAQVALPAGVGLLAFLALTPLIYRFDRLACVVTSLLALGIGTGTAAFITLEPAPRPVEISEDHLAAHDRARLCDLLPAAREPELLPAPPARSFGKEVDPSLFDLELEMLGSNQLLLTILNRSEETVTLIEPLDGSVHGWLQPFYEIEAFNKSGERLPLPPRCGMFGGTYSLKTTRVVPPGGRFSVRLWLPWELDEGVHRVRASYHFDPKKVRLSHEPVTGGVNIEGGPLTCRRLERAFVGTLTSPSLTLAGPDRKVTHMIEWVKGSLDKEIIRRISDHGIDGVEACFRRSRAAHGKVTVLYTIASIGNVVMARVERSTVVDRRVGRCIISAVRRWRFPQCKCGGIVMVLQTFGYR